MMNSQEIETALRYNIAIVIMIWNDSEYGLIKWHQQRRFGRTGNISFNNPDFVKYAESYGAIGHRPTSDQDFEETLDKCLNSDGVHLIDLAVDYSLNHSILNVLLQAKSCLL